MAYRLKRRDSAGSAAWIVGTELFFCGGMDRPRRLMICASFTQETPGLVMMAILLLGGFFRSLQFTAVNTLAYADINQTDMSRASSFAAMGQQLGISLGVGVAAETVSLSMSLRGSQSVDPQDVLIGFLVIGTLCSLAALSFWRLSSTAGASLRQK
jgi:fucose permease